MTIEVARWKLWCAILYDNRLEGDQRVMDMCVKENKIEEVTGLGLRDVVEKGFVDTEICEILKIS